MQAQGEENPNVAHVRPNRWDDSEATEEKEYYRKLVILKDRENQRSPQRRARSGLEFGSPDRLNDDLLGSTGVLSRSVDHDSENGMRTPRAREIKKDFYYTLNQSRSLSRVRKSGDLMN